MEDSLPFVIAFGGQIKGDIVLRLAFFIQASNLDGLAFEDGSDLANAFGVFECENLDGPRSLYLRMEHEGTKDLAHQLEAQGNIASSLLSGVSNYCELRRLHFSPGVRGKAQKRKQQSGKGPKAHSSKIVLWTGRDRSLRET